MSDDLIDRLSGLSKLRRETKSNLPKSFQDGEPDIVASLLDEAVAKIYDLEQTIHQAKLFIESTCEDGFVDEVFRPNIVGRIPCDCGCDPLYREKKK